MHMHVCTRANVYSWWLVAVADNNPGVGRALTASLEPLGSQVTSCQTHIPFPSVAQVEAVIHPQFLADLLSPEQQRDPLALMEELEQEEGLSLVQVNKPEGLRVSEQEARVLLANPALSWMV